MSKEGLPETIFSRVLCNVSPRTCQAGLGVRLPIDERFVLYSRVLLAGKSADGAVTFKASEF
jgi:hypothetical protein